ncbi:MAG: hypothetical protein FJ009_20595 [Chloroflexi bacterium]|nr:hypothetical protein [Chloroflexota bacterium]
MRFICVLLMIVACLLTGCEQPPEYLSATQIHATVTAAVATAQAALRTPSVTLIATATPLPSHTFTQTPSAIPTAIVSPTPWVWLPSPTPIPTHTPTLVSTATSTPTATRTPTLTLTPAPPKLSIAILGCESGFDLSLGLGYVTNAYVRARNLGGVELTNVCLTLNTNGEGKLHPTKSRCISTLRVNYEVTTILTVDAEYKNLTAIEVIATANPAVSDRVAGTSCKALSGSELGSIKSGLNAPKPIQGQ